MKKFLLVLILIFACPVHASVKYDHIIEQVVFTKNDKGFWTGTIKSVDCKIYISADPSIWIVKRIIYKNKRNIDQAGFCKFDSIAAKGDRVKTPLILPRAGFHAEWNTYHYFVVKNYNGTYWECMTNNGTPF